MMSPEEIKQVASAVVTQGISLQWALGISGAILTALFGILGVLIASIYNSKSKDIAKNTANITQLTLDVTELTIVLREDIKARAITDKIRDTEIQVLKESGETNKELFKEELTKVTESFLQLTEGDPEIKADLEKWMDERILIVEGDVEVVKEEMVKLNNEWNQYLEFKLASCEKKEVVVAVAEHLVDKQKSSKS